MIEIKPPTTYEKTTFTIFLAGSIEMGTAIHWQEEIVKALDSFPCTILNPRRESWDSTWVQEESNTFFNEQVSWELDGILEVADLIIFYFDKATKSPVTLLELGLALASHKECLVCCPPGFWRKGNVDIVCKRFGVEVLTSLPTLINHLLEKRNHHVHD